MQPKYHVGSPDVLGPGHQCTSLDLVISGGLPVKVHIVMSMIKPWGESKILDKTLPWGESKILKHTLPWTVSSSVMSCLVSE